MNDDHWKNQPRDSDGRWTDEPGHAGHNPDDLIRAAAGHLHALPDPPGGSTYFDPETHSLLTSADRRLHPAAQAAKLQRIASRALAKYDWLTGPEITDLNSDDPKAARRVQIEAQGWWERSRMALLELEHIVVKNNLPQRFKLKNVPMAFRLGLREPRYPDANPGKVHKR